MSRGMESERARSRSASRRNRAVWIGLTGAAALLAGCGQQSEAHYGSASQAMEMSKVVSQPDASRTSAGAGEPVAGSPVADSEPVSSKPLSPATASKRSPAPKAEGNGEETLPLARIADSQPDRYLIKNGTLSLEVTNAKEALDKLMETVKALKGYVGEMNESVDALGARSITAQLRIPFTRFDGSVQQIEQLGRVLDRHVNAEDVTEDFVDTQAKLRNLKRTEVRLLDHLSRTGKLSDTLLVEKEITRVRQEIEQSEGHVRFLAHRIAFSTLTVDLKEKPRLQSVVPTESFSAGKQASDAARSLVGFGQNVASVFIWLGVWSILWAPLLLVAWHLVRRAQERRMALRTAMRTEPPSQTAS